MAIAGIDDGHISVQSSFTERDLMLDISGARWHKDMQCWRIPLTWAACQQLRGVFGRGLEITPELQEWGWKEKNERVNPAMWMREALDLVPASGEEIHAAAWLDKIEADTDLQLKDFQRADVAFLVTCGQALLGSEPGTGKTASMIRTLQVLIRMGLEPLPALVVCPNSLKNTVWARELSRWAPELRVAVVEGNALKRRKLIAGEWDVLVINYEALRAHTRQAPYGTMHLTDKQKERKELNGRGLRTVVADECVPATAVMTTPHGLLPISKIRRGDLVLGVDHATGEEVWSEVTGVMCSPMAALTRVGPLSLTENHPIWVSDSGHIAYSSPYEWKNKGTANLRVVQGSVLREAAVSVFAQRTAVLQQAMPQQVHSQPTRVPGNGGSFNASCSSTTGSYGETGRSSVWAWESLPRPGSPQARGGKQYRERLEAAEWGEWHGSYRPASDVAFCTRGALGTGVRGEGLGETARLSYLLQAGHRPFRTKIWSGDSRTRAWQERNSTGSQEERFPGSSWLDNSLGVERGNPGRYLWNIETATGNYFANGVLVHNCHRMKDPSTQLTRAVWAVLHEVEYRFLLTGTPVNSHCGDLWALLHGILPEWFPSRTRYLKRYALFGYNWFGGQEILGLRPENAAEFRAVTEPVFRRVLKETVLPQLPPKLPVQFRETWMTPKQAKAYAELEKDLLTWLDSGEMIAAPSTFSQLARLVQFASAYAEIDDKDQVKLSEPSSKVDDLIDFLEETGEEPLVVAAVSRQLIELAAARLAKEEISYTQVTGAVSVPDRAKAVEDFQSGRVRVMLLTLGAGSEGLTLTRADTILFLQESWSPLQNEQAVDRIHRIGSEGHDRIRIIKQISPGTIEERKQEVLGAKAVRIEEILRDRDVLRRLLGR